LAAPLWHSRHRTRSRSRARDSCRERYWMWCPEYPLSDDYVFASPTMRGAQPNWPDNLMKRYIRPVAREAGIHKNIGWHTFRHSFATLLKANGEDVKTVHELLRHATSRITLDVYTQAVNSTIAKNLHQAVSLDRQICAILHKVEEQCVTSGGLAGSPGGTGVSGPISVSEMASNALSVVGRLKSTRSMAKAM